MVVGGGQFLLQFRYGRHGAVPFAGGFAGGDFLFTQIAFQGVGFGGGHLGGLLIQVLLPGFQQAIALHNHGNAGVAEYAVEIAFRGVVQTGLLQFPQQFGGGAVGIAALAR